ncbi:MAG: hypothetical protein PHS40_00715 [Mariniphaga sp.]|nr:hypothetical protein [Mariniphaga sp.]
MRSNVLRIPGVNLCPVMEFEFEQLEEVNTGVSSGMVKLNGLV